MAPRPLSRKLRRNVAVPPAGSTDGPSRNGLPGATARVVPAPLTTTSGTNFLWTFLRGARSSSTRAMGPSIAAGPVLVTVTVCWYVPLLLPRLPTGAGEPGLTLTRPVMLSGPVIGGGGLTVSVNVWLTGLPTLLLAVSVTT